MKKKKTMKLFVLLAFLAILIILYFAVKQKSEVSETEVSDTSVQEIFSIENQKIKELSFIIEDAEVTFQQTDDDWVLLNDEQFPVNKDQISVLTESLLSITANRTLTNVDNLAEYGLDTPVDIIKITDQENHKTVITVGNTNDMTGDCYVYLNDDLSTVYTIDGDLSTVFSGSLMNYAQGEEFPSITVDDIQKVEIHSKKHSLILESDESMVSGWKVTDGTGKSIESDITKVSEIKSTAAGLTFVNFYEYDCQDFSKYGLHEPYAVIRIDDMVLSVGDEDENNNRYVNIEGSKEVHSISIESIFQLLDNTLDDCVNLSVSNIDLTMIDQLDITYENEKHIFTMEEEDSVITYYKDGEETDTLTFSSFYNKLIGITAQKLTDHDSEKSCEIQVVFLKTDGIKVEVKYYPYDTNYYLAVVGDSKYLVNKMDIRDMVNKYKEL